MAVISQRRRRLRQFWVQVHLWPGMLLGAVFAVLGLSGSVLCFYPEIDLWLNPAQQVAGSAPATFSVQQALDALHAARPDYGGAWRLEMPLADGRPLSARYYRPPETAGRSFAPFMATLDPQTVTITSQRFWGDYAMTWLYNLHYTLLWEKPGRMAVGVVGLFSLLSLGSGLYLWWPAGSRWREALRVRIRPGIVRATYDWHTLGGIYGFVLLLVISFSGVFLALPEYGRPLVEAFSPLGRSATPHSADTRGDMISADLAVARAQAALPGAVLRWVETPATADSVFRLSFWQAGDPGYRFPRSNVWVDAYSGDVLAVRDWRREATGDVFLAWQHPLHNGEGFGLAGRLLASLAGLLPALLWVTGVMRWSQKRQARAKLSALADGRPV
ncbi:PepSY-associated TM helix domain-containing protein [Dechloromonas denitrificans]|nr:PepSY-associated TM helix domain-containing protein [Dechloromonas denitrificans]